MRNFILLLNGKAIADYFTKGRAQNAFDRMVRRYNSSNGCILELYDLVNGHRIASSI